MVALLLALLLGVPSLDPGSAVGASETDDCEALYTTLTEDPPTAPDAYLALADDALQCFGAPTSDTSLQVYRLHHRRINQLVDVGRWGDALQTVDAYFERFGPLEEDTANWDYRMHQWRAYIHFFTGDLLRAASAYARALPHARAYAPQHAALIAGEVGLIYYRLGDYARAGHYLERGFDLMAGAEEQGTEEMDNVLLRLRGTQAALLLEQAQIAVPLDTARVEQSQAVVESLLEQIDYRLDHPESISSFLRLGQIARIQGAFAAADDYLATALDAARLQASAQQASVVSTEQARLYLDQRRLDAARERLDAAEARATPTDYRTQREIALQRGRAYYVAGRPAAAVPHLEEAIGHAEAERDAFRATEWSALRPEWHDPYRLLVHVYMAMGEHEQAIATLAQTRARHLYDLRLQTRLLEELPVDERVRFDALTDELTQVRQALADASPAQRLGLLNEEARLVAARDTLVELEQRPPSPSIDALQRALGARDQTLLSYFLTSPSDHVANWDEARSHVFLISADTVVTAPVNASNEEVRRLLTEVSPLLTEGSDALTLNASAFALAPLHDLYRLLVAPVEKHLAEGERLVVIPDRDLFALPFGLLLPEPAPRFQYAEAPFLLRSHPVSVEVAERLLLPDNQDQPVTEVDVLALGRSAFDDVSASARRAEATMPQRASLTPLPAVRAELESIRSLFLSTLTALDEDATERVLMDHINHAKIVHLASHVELNAAHPFNNSIALHPDADDPSGRLDGQFTLSKLGQRDVPVDLVVLSGCNTARGPLRAGEGMASLQMGFRALGVRSSLATLWLIEDESSATLMEHFYRNLREGQTKDVALQQAQLRFLDDSRSGHQSPFFWAAPVLYGASDAVQLQPRRILPAWAFALGGILFLFVSLVAYRSRSRPSTA